MPVHQEGHEHGPGRDGDEEHEALRLFREGGLGPLRGQDEQSVEGLRHHQEDGRDLEGEDEQVEVGAVLLPVGLEVHEGEGQEQEEQEEEGAQEGQVDPRAARLLEGVDLLDGRLVRLLPRLQDDLSLLHDHHEGGHLGRRGGLAPARLLAVEGEVGADERPDVLLDGPAELAGDAEQFLGHGAWQPARLVQGDDVARRGVFLCPAQPLAADVLDKDGIGAVDGVAVGVDLSVLRLREHVPHGLFEGDGEALRLELLQGEAGQASPEGVGEALEELLLRLLPAIPLGRRLEEALELFQVRPGRAEGGAHVAGQVVGHARVPVVDRQDLGPGFSALLFRGQAVHDLVVEGGPDIVRVHAAHGQRRGGLHPELPGEHGEDEEEEGRRPEPLVFPEEVARALARVGLHRAPEAGPLGRGFRARWVGRDHGHEGLPSEAILADRIRAFPGPRPCRRRG